MSYDRRRKTCRSLLSQSAASVSVAPPFLQPFDGTAVSRLGHEVAGQTAGLLTDQSALCKPALPDSDVTRLHGAAGSGQLPEAASSVLFARSVNGGVQSKAAVLSVEQAGETGGRASHSWQRRRVVAFAWGDGFVFLRFLVHAHSRFVETTPCALRGRRLPPNEYDGFTRAQAETAAPRPRRDTGWYLRPRRLRTRRTHTHSYVDEVPRPHQTSQHFSKHHGVNKNFRPLACTPHLPARWSR